MWLQVQQGFPQSPMDVPVSPQRFRFPDPYPGPPAGPLPGPSRPMQQRPSMMGQPPTNQPYLADQMSLHSNQPAQQMMHNTNSLHSPQGIGSGMISHMDSTGATLPSGQYNHVDQ